MIKITKAGNSSTRICILEKLVHPGGHSEAITTAQLLQNNLNLSNFAI